MSEFQPVEAVPAIPSAPAPGAPTPDTAMLSRLHEAAAGIDGIGELPLPQAASRLEALHSELQAALAELDRS